MNTTAAIRKTPIANLNQPAPTPAMTSPLSSMRDDEGADDGPEDRAEAAEERHAADDRRGDGLQLEGLALIGQSHVGAHHGEDAWTMWRIPSRS